MDFGAPPDRNTQDASQETAKSFGRRKGDCVGCKGEAIAWSSLVQGEGKSGRGNTAEAHPLAELLSCPQETNALLNDSAQCLQFRSGEIVFSQSSLCRGLYVLLSGRYVRKAERMETQLALKPARTGELVELAAALGSGQHNYTLSAQTAGSAFLLPMEALQVAFQSHPPLRMLLLQELAREVSRAYQACRLSRVMQTRHQNPGGSSS
jgi:CRP-like cAMP-binding protein